VRPLGSRGTAGGGSLIRRTVVVSVLLSAIVGAVFFLLLLVIRGQQNSADQTQRSQRALLAADQLYLVIVDIETGQRGFIITGQERFLQPWDQGRAAFPGAAATFERRAAGSGDDQAAHARQIIRDAANYITSYSIPLVQTARGDLAAAQTAQVTAEGKRRVDELRSELAQYQSIEHRLLAEREAVADADATRATVAAGAGLGASIVLVLLTGGYLIQQVVRPIREASAMAGWVAGGDLTARMPDTGPGEVGVLQRAFNTMAGSLQESHDELRRVADEQAALRRVATLVASGVPPPEVFAAVAAETGRVLGAASITMARYEPDGTVVVVGTWAESRDVGQAPAVGSRWLPEEDSIPVEVRRTRQAAQRGDGQQAADGMAAWARQHGLRAAVGSPVFVEGRLWGVIIAFAGAGGLRTEASQARMQAFTELAAMAVANSESREQLAASRARVVVAADESRRRIERNLHDDTQQRLISLALEMRVVADTIPPEQAELRQQWDMTVQSLAAVTEDLREVSRGLHPAILETAGLGPALRALARRSAVPVDLSVNVRGRLPEQAEITAYYVVSEALTNVAKHAHASQVQVEARLTDSSLRLLVRDDGRGGADPARGSGLLGLGDRVGAADGRIEIVSPRGGGTSLLAMIPVPRRGDDSGATS
jgi:signal transduction histidine kinase